MRFLSGLGMVLLLAALALAQGVDPAALLKPPVDAWLTYHGDYSGQRHTRLNQITAENVGQLKRVWSFQAGQQQIKGTPILAARHHLCHLT